MFRYGTVRRGRSMDSVYLIFKKSISHLTLNHAMSIIMLLKRNSLKEMCNYTQILKKVMFEP